MMLHTAGMRSRLNYGSSPLFSNVANWRPSVCPTRVTFKHQGYLAVTKMLPHNELHSGFAAAHLALLESRKKEGNRTGTR